MVRNLENLCRGAAAALSAWIEETDSRFLRFGRFVTGELKPFPGRGWAAARIVVAGVITVILSETLRVPFPAFSAYLIFFIANDDGVRSAKLGIAALLGATVALAVSMGVTICFMDTPWFRVPVTLFFATGAIWLSRTLVMAVMGRLLAVIFVLYLSLADTIYDPEVLTKTTLWLWSVVALPVGITVLVNFIFADLADTSVKKP